MPHATLRRLPAYGGDGTHGEREGCHCDDATLSRAVLLLRYQHDLTIEESAAILEIPIGTAKSRLHYGVTTLRKYLTSERKPA